MSENWLLLAFITPVLLGLNSIVNKWIIDKYFKDPISSLIFMLLGNMLFVIPAAFFIDLSIPLINWLIITGLGVLFGLMFYFQFKVVKERDASEVAIILRLKPVLLMVLAYIILEERLSLNDVYGVIFLSLGGLLIASKDIDIKKLKVSNHLLNLMIFILLSSLVSLARKVIIVSNDFWPVFYWTNFGSMMGGVFLLADKSNRNRFIGFLKKSPLKVYGVKILTQITYLVGLYASTLALVKGPVSVISGVYSIQPFFVFLYSFLISKYFPNVIREDISKISIVKKLTSIALIILGSWLII